VGGTKELNADVGQGKDEGRTYKPGKSTFGSSIGGAPAGMGEVRSSEESRVTSACGGSSGWIGGKSRDEGEL